MHDHERMHIMSSPQSSASGDIDADEGSAQKPSSAATVIPESEYHRPTTKRRKTGKQSGFPNYSEEEVGILLDNAEKRRPFGSNDWAAVVRLRLQP